MVNPDLPVILLGKSSEVQGNWQLAFHQVIEDLVKLAMPIWSIANVINTLSGVVGKIELKSQGPNFHFWTSKSKSEGVSFNWLALFQLKSVLSQNWDCIQLNREGKRFQYVWCLLEHSSLRRLTFATRSSLDILCLAKSLENTFQCWQVILSYIYFYSYNDYLCRSLYSRNSLDVDNDTIQKFRLYYLPQYYVYKKLCTLI